MTLLLPDTRPIGLTLVVLAVALTAAVLPHELAHAAAARATGLEVTQLALGFGPRVVGRMVRGVALDLRLAPVGGYARIEGLDEAPRATRLFVALAGPAVNVLLAAAWFVAATVAAGATDPARAIGAAGEIAGLLLGGTAELFATYAADPGNLALFPIAGLPSTALATSGALAGGLPMLCILVAALSLSTGIVNLLPWPPLDGAIALGAITGQRFGWRSALAVDALLLLVLVANLADGVRVASSFAG